MERINGKIPVTILTGFLGAGKTTLLNRILNENHGKRIAVIENEFGEIGIDQELVIREKEQILEMNNGCICCTVRGDLIRILKDLYTRENPPEYVLIETTGMADPSPVAQTFLTDPEIGERYLLDAIVTLVDAKHIDLHLHASVEAKQQVAFADVVILNKVDLVSDEEISRIEDALRSVNRFATVYRARQADVPIDRIVGIGSFDTGRVLEINPDFLEAEYPFEYGAWFRFDAGSYALSLKPNGNERSIKLFFVGAKSESADEERLMKIAHAAAILFSAQGVYVSEGARIAPMQSVYQIDIPEQGLALPIDIANEGLFALFTEHEPEEFSLKITDSVGNSVVPVLSRSFHPSHRHDGEVSSVGVEIDGEVDVQAFTHFLDFVVQAYGNDLYRYKGVLAFSGETRKVILQGVHMLFEVAPSVEWGEETRKNRIIFIGKNLERGLLTQGFLACRSQGYSP
jgi:G3E family GTPase